MGQDRFDGDFADIADQFYPGSRQKISERPGHSRRPSPGMNEWDGKPRTMLLPNGTESEFFTVGALAKALGREPGTIRKWEQNGVIPPASFRTGNADPRGVRRLYSRAQIEGIVRIAHDEGILINPERKALASTSFTPRVFELFAQLRAAL